MPFPELLPSQKIALRGAVTDPPIIAWAGGFRSGKTFGLCVALLAILKCHPRDSNFLVVGRTLGSVTRNVVPIIQHLCGELGWSFKHYRGSASRLFIEGRVIHLFGAPDESAGDTIAGMTASGAFIDEVSRIPESVFWMVWSRCSMPNARLLVSSNKDNPFGWFKTEVWEKLSQWNGLAIENNLHENTFIDAATRARYEETFSGHYYRRYIANEWVAAGGAVYTEFDVIEPCEVKGRVFLGLDWGPAGVTAGVYFSATPYGFAILDEYRHDGRRQGRLTSEEHAQAIRRQGYDIERVIIDPSAIPLMDALRSAGYDVIGANNDLDKGIILTDHVLRTGRLKIANNCKELLGEIDAYVWNTQEDRPYKRDDHSVDAMRYGAVELMPIRDLTPIRIGGL